MNQIGNAQHEADRVQDVALPGPIQPGDGVKLRIEAMDLGTLAVRFETIDDDGFDVHFFAIDYTLRPLAHRLAQSTKFT